MFLGGKLRFGCIIVCAREEGYHWLLCINSLIKLNFHYIELDAGCSASFFVVMNGTDYI